MTSQSFYEDDSVAIKENGFTKTGFTFAGWNTQADGKGTAYAVGYSYSENSSITLYAQWTAIPYTVTLNMDGAIESVSGAGTYTYGSTVNIGAVPKTTVKHSKVITVYTHVNGENTGGLTVLLSTVLESAGFGGTIAEV